MGFDWWIGGGGGGTRWVGGEYGWIGGDDDSMMRLLYGQHMVCMCMHHAQQQPHSESKTHVLLVCATKVYQHTQAEV